jgi:hypothetical protein
LRRWPHGKIAGALLRAAGAPTPLIVEKLLEHTARRGDDAIDDAAPEFGRRVARFADHAVLGKPRIVAPPRPCRAALEH